jgi:gamma-glutamylcysteine synthetase
MLFPEIRIKNIIEIRSMDTLTPEDVLAVPALLQGLIYDETVFGRLESMLMDLSETEFPWYQQVAARDGLEGEVNRVKHKNLAVKMMEMALESMNLSEGCRLSVFFDRYTRHGISPADRVLERFFAADENPWKWFQIELDAEEEKQNSFINYPCKHSENLISWISN